MPRLINADEAIKKAEYYDWDMTAINNASTVEAIPVSYIQKYIKELHSIARQAEEGQDGFAFSCTLKAIHYENLLENWEYDKEKYNLTESKEK